jgi:caa(3)-type oxidase subunit IV
MNDAAHGNPYRIYWITWIILLGITLAMLLGEKLHMPRGFLVVFLLAFMLIKAVMISGNFMHLRYEHKRMAIMVGVGILVTSMILFTFITPEAASVLAKSVR